MLNSSLWPSGLGLAHLSKPFHLSFLFPSQLASFLFIKHALLPFTTGPLHTLFPYLEGFPLHLFT